MMRWKILKKKVRNELGSRMSLVERYAKTCVGVL